MNLLSSASWAAYGLGQPDRGQKVGGVLLLFFFGGPLLGYFPTMAGLLGGEVMVEDGTSRG